MEFTQEDQYISLSMYHIRDMVNAQVNREFDAMSSVADDLVLAIMDITDEEDDPAEVFEWWTVSDEFAFAAKAANEVVVETPFGSLWGRQTTGQPVFQDRNVQTLLDVFRIDLFSEEMSYQQLPGSMDFLLF